MFYHCRKQLLPFLLALATILVQNHHQWSSRSGPSIVEGNVIIDATLSLIDSSQLENVSLPLKTEQPKVLHAFSMLKFMNPKSLLNEYQNALRGQGTWFTCQLCSVSISLIRLSQNINTIKSIFDTLCSSLNYEDYQVCDGLSNLFGEEMVYILVNSKLENAEICGLITGSKCMPSESEYYLEEKWQHKPIPLPFEVEEQLKYLNDFEPQNNVSSILHISDFHLDLYYQETAPAFCSQPLCCRATSKPTEKSHPAGHWGSFDNCDSVLRTVESLINSTVTDPFDQHYRYVIFTGDYIAHDVWNTSKAEIIKTTRTLNNLFKKNFPSDKIVIPVIGNHEGFPVDQFCPPDLGLEKFSSQWLYEELLDQWKDWIPSDYHETFRFNGYYSRVDGKARFIVLNMNYCARLNFWIALNYTIDLGNMLHWFQKELQNATISQQYVYIVGHIAPDTDECVSHWVAAYRNIIEIYSKIIRGQFFGHTHFDEVRLYYSNRNNSKPIGVAYLAPSVTTYSNVNPAFRLYATDPDSGTITDHMTYYLNLTKSNNEYKLFNPFEKPKPVWEFEYSAKNSYSLKSLSPESWQQFAADAANNRIILQNYYQHYGRYDPEAVINKSNSTLLDVIQDRIFVKT